MFYQNVIRKYRHTYSLELMDKNIDEALDAMFQIEQSLLRRQPTVERWQKAGWHMANAGKWYYAYTISGDTITIEDACHEQNMH
jgi:sulfite reductase beta subunit-like hemoprotein